VVRIVAVVAVVAGHAYSKHPLTSRLIFSWHVPIFFVLSGYLWTRGRSLRSEVRRRAKTLLVPYLAWLLIVTAAWLIVRQHRGVPLHERFFHKLIKGGTYIGMPYSAFWFITALFVAAVAYRLIEMVAPRTAPALAAAAGAVGIVMAEHSPQALRSVWWAAGLALPCLLFVAAGSFLRTVRPHVRAPALSGSILVLLGAFGLWQGVDPLNLKGARFGDPVISVLLSVTVCFGLILLAEGATNLWVNWSRAISAVATAALPVIFAHGIVLVVLADDPFYAPPGAFAAALILPWVGALVVSRSPRLAATLL
jgi:fucose 4-O-acetylase-like acetyltransferase